ncbi:hypothetical protein ECNE1487_2848, partial [Escherichia coli NE1487]
MIIKSPFQGDIIHAVFLYV